MLLAGEKKESSSCSWWRISGCFRKPLPPPEVREKMEKRIDSPESEFDVQKEEKKPGGWRAMPFILGNETLERLATIGLAANFMVYLMKIFHMEQVDAANILSIWSGLSNLIPLFGAFLSDTYLGRFKTIAFSSFACLLGMMTVTLTAWLPELHPPPCHSLQSDSCNGPKRLHIGILLMGLGFLSVGTGGIRPCSIPFGVDQFDQRTEEGLKGVASFFNWYYTTFTMVLIITQTVVVYIQDQISWVIGFALPTALMACAVILFFVGARLYVYVKPEGSTFSGIAQVFAAAYKKRKLNILADDEKIEYYDPPPNPRVLYKLPLTKQFRFFDKAAVLTDSDLTTDGAPVDHWRLCSIQQVEEVKCMIRIIPVWSAGIISLTAMSQQSTFAVSQALKMDRQLGPHFQIPAGSVTVISLITIALWLPFYDRFLVPSLRKITGNNSGITLLQRIGIGIVFAILAMIVAGLIERVRRTAALNSEDPTGIAPMSVFWLAPQLILMGFSEAFNIIGQIEFFNSQFPEHMRSIANSLFSLSFAGANYLSSLLLTTVHKFSGRHGRPDWLNKDINTGKLDYYYYLIAGLGLVNSVYFWLCARSYRYKDGPQIGTVGPDESTVDIEMSDRPPNH